MALDVPHSLESVVAVDVFDEDGFTIESDAAGDALAHSPAETDQWLAPLATDFGEAQSLAVGFCYEDGSRPGSQCLHQEFNCELEPVGKVPLVVKT